MARVLVTGDSGFIGSHCVVQLLLAGHDVRTTVRNLGRVSVSGDVVRMIDMANMLRWVNH
jgi:uncharacterized protein YbjT (DUF2867 family)